jgi:hypothetical protein
VKGKEDGNNEEKRKASSPCLGPERCTVIVIIIIIIIPTTKAIIIINTVYSFICFTRIFMKWIHMPKGKLSGVFATKSCKNEPPPAFSSVSVRP